MTNPFDDDSGTFVVVVNHEGRHALWPTFAALPAGWTSVCGPEGRDACLAYVREHWTDLRPVAAVTPRSGS